MRALLKLYLFCSLLDINIVGSAIILRTMAAANKGRCLSGAWQSWGRGRGNLYEPLSNIPEDTWQTKGGSTKRMRHSTGGASFELNEQQEEAKRLSLSEFKDMNTDDKLESIFTCLQSMKVSSECRLDKVEQSVHGLQNQQSATVDQLKLLQYKSIDIEARSRRNNLLFRGIPEVNGEDTMQVIQAFLADNLELDPDEICIQRAHRIGRIQTRKPHYHGQTTKHRPLIIALRDSQDVELIIGNASKLRGTGFGINRDLPKEILDARKPLWSKMKSIKEQDTEAKVNIVFPAKLIKNGRVIADQFPDWNTVMKKSRVNPKLFINDIQPGASSEQPPRENQTWPDIDHTQNSQTPSAMITEQYDAPPTPQQRTPGVPYMGVNGPREPAQNAQSANEAAVASFDTDSLGTPREDETEPPT